MENKCMESCPKNAPFYIEITEESKIIKKCVTSCLENGYNYFDSNKKCINIIPEGKMIFNGGLIDECPTGMQFDDESKKCIKITESNYFQILENEDEEPEVEELNECDNYITTSSQCVEKCPIGEHFIASRDNNKYCLSNCDTLVFLGI